MSGMRQRRPVGRTAGRTREIRLSMRVWDAPVRLFHWGVVVLVGLSYASARLGWMGTHFLSGEAVLALLIFRLVWGFIGSDTARFGRFLVSPAAGPTQLRDLTRREPDNQIGYTAPRGWMVLVLLLLLAAQVGTGLLANAHAASQGPLANVVPPSVSGTLTYCHFVISDLILAAIALHLLLIVVYAVLKRQDLVRPMVTGRKRLPATTIPPRMANPLLALGVLAVAAVLVWLLVAFG